jgi:PTH1 family peptidyl-tRNA hydrolase
MANSEAQVSKKVVVGLGNPGKAYENTYHNVGWLALAAMTGPEAGHKKYKELFEYAAIGDIVFVWPLTYMNDSGKAVREALKKFNAKPKDLLVIHDDSDLTVGAYKIASARGSAGHKGVQSIIDVLKTNAFARIRIGIRPAREAKRQKAGEFALKNITPANRKIFDSIFSKATAYTQTSS